MSYRGQDPKTESLTAIESLNGSDVLVTAENTSNTASSGSKVRVKVAGASGHDATVHFSVSGVTDWTQGIDNSDSDSFVIAASTALGTSNMFAMTTAGAITITGAINGTTIPTSKTLTVTTDNLSVFAATTSAQLAGVISDETGSGALVFATSPTLVTPTLGVAIGTKLTITGASDVVQSIVTGHSTQTSNILDVQKSDATKLFSVTNTAGSLIRGTTTNDSAAAGFVGEYMSQTRLFASAVSLTTATTANVTATPLTLTPGDWDVSAGVGYSTAGTTVLAYTDIAISRTSATLPATSVLMNTNANGEFWNECLASGVATGGAQHSTQILPYRVSVASNTTFYLVCRGNFTVSTCDAYGYIQARRVR